MFGYIQANLNELSEEEKTRYRAFYCGLCHSLGELHGQAARLGLSYDMVFVSLLLTSLYEPEGRSETGWCASLPSKKHLYEMNEYTEFAADMLVALTYFNCLDDWKDDKNLLSKGYSNLLHKKYMSVKEKWPKACDALETQIALLGDIEKKKTVSPDAAANCSGRLMEAVITPYEDQWTPYLKKIGFGIGKFIYLADAACDYYSDLHKKSYNPLVLMNEKPECIRPMLTQILGSASENFEKLPLVQDVHLLRNILYSGVWIKYNQKMQKQRKGRQNDSGSL